MALSYKSIIEGVKVVDNIPSELREFLTPEFLTTARDLERMNRQNRHILLQRRAEAQAAYDGGELPRYDPATREIRESRWGVRHQSRPELRFRYMELVSPISIPSRIMRGFDAITKDGTNNEGSYMGLFFADNEDAEAPSIRNLLTGQRNLMLAIRGELQLPGYDPIIVIPGIIYRPRGLQFDEVHALVDDKPMSATNFDMLLFYTLNWKALKDKGTGPNFYIPKLEYHPEAKHIAGIADFLEGTTNQPRGFIDASLIIETAPALLNMHEFAWELSDRLSAYSFGRYDLQFHMTKTLAQHANRIFPDATEISMESPFLVRAQQAFVDTCYMRSIYPIGGMEQGVPQRDPEGNRQVLEGIIAGADGEIRKKMVGKWALHPIAVGPIRDRFREALGGKPIFDFQPQGILPSPEELFAIPKGRITYEDTARETRYTLEYFTNWLQGTGAVQLDMKMHDAATAEKGRGVVWTRRRHGVTLVDTGETLDDRIIDRAIREAESKIRAEIGDSPELRVASHLLREALLSQGYGQHMTIRSYPHLVQLTQGR